MEGQSAPPKQTKQQQVTIAPFDSHHSIVLSLQTRDPNSLIAALNQIEKRASALNAKPAPRASPDLLLDYLQHNPGCEGIFQAWDLANKTNSSPLSSSILLTLTSLLRLLSTDPFTPSPLLIKTLLSAQYTPYLERALNPGRNDVTTAALKLCNVLVGFAGGRFARRVFGAFGWSPKITTRLYKTRLRTLTSSTALTRPDLRTLLVLLVLGFLSVGDVRLKTQVLETKGLLSGLFKGLGEDPESVVNLVLEVVGREVVGDRRVGLEARRNVFDEGTINELVKLYDYPLPPLSPSDPTLPPSHPSLSIHRFLLLLTHWLADQIASSPPGRSSGPQKVLGNVLKSLKVTEEREQRELGLRILGEAPVLAGAFWSKFPSSLDPRLSSRWISAITFATRVVSLPVPVTLSPPVPSSSSTGTSALLPAPPSLQSVLDTLLPPSLSRTWYTKSLSHEVPLVSFLSSLFLLSILQKTSATLEAIAATSARLEEAEGGRWAQLGRRVRKEVGERVPGAEAVVGLMKGVAADAQKKEAAKKEGKKDKGKKEDVPPVPVEEEKAAEEKKDKNTNAALLLRTNVALRLLYQYHRVCPHLIAALKFDFVKLPQTFSSSSSSTSTSSSTSQPLSDETQDQAPGLTALSASYALRLSALHSASSGSATAAWSRPADHYRNVLVPLFELYRSGGMTRGNREMVRRMVGGQMRSPVLFGAGSGGEGHGEGEGEGEGGEVEVWLRAVAASTTAAVSDPAGSKEVLDFFQEAVRKTLTTPLKAADMAALAAPAEEGSFSPLLKTVLAALPALSSPPPPALVGFVRNLFLSFLGSGSGAGRVAVARKFAAEVKDVLSVKGEEGRKVGRWVKECLAVVEAKVLEEEAEAAEGLREKVREVVEAAKEEDEEGEGAADREEELRKLVEGLGPKSGNVFVALSGSGDDDQKLLKKTLAALPLPLALLHARTSDFSSASTSALLLSLITSNASSILPSLNLLLQRFSASPSLALGRFLAAVYASPASAADEGVKSAFRARVAAKDGGVRKVWEKKEGEKEETYEAVALLVASVFDAEKGEDVERVRPFTEAVLADLTPVADGKEEKKKRRKSQVASTTLSVRVLSSAPLLPFFSASSSLPLLSALLAAPTDSPAPSPLLEAAFARVLALPSTSTDLLPLWTAQFSRLNKLAAEGSDAAGKLLAKGAEGLMPFSSALSSSRAKGKAAEEGWRAHAAEWADELLSSSTSTLSPPQATALTALVYRSSAARERFVAYLAAAAANEDTGLLPLAGPLRALIDVAGAKGEKDALSLPEGLAARFVEQIAASPSSSAVSEEAYTTAHLLSTSSPSAQDEIRSALLARLASLERDEYRAPLVRVASEGGKEVVEGVVNGAVEGLVRRFAEDEEDGEEVRELVEELASVVEKTDNLALKGHLLSPLITAVATRRLDQLYALKLATALSKVHQFKDNEVTRHLNEIFASPFFLTLSSSSPTESTTPVLALVLALSHSSASAAANARAVDRLIPFYRGTLSSLDRSLLSLFQRIELASGQSISPVLKGWNPSAADSASTLLDGSRISALGASQRNFVRRSWSRAFASSRTVYTAEDDEKAYDPRFLLSFVAALVEEDELKPQEWTTLLESGALGTVVASLASSEASMRVVARATLARLLKKIHPLTFREKDELLLVLTQVRLSIYSPASEAIPSSIALFLAHCTSLLGQPDSPLYPAFQRFLLQRSTVDLRDVPMFYLMIYSSNSDEFAAEPREERRWMVRFLTEGLVRTQDWKIYRRRQVFELLASLFQASRQDAPLRKLILQFLLRATSLPAAARELLARNGLLGWLAAQSPLDVAERRLLLGIVRNIVDVLAFEEKKLEGVADAVEAVEAAVGDEVAVIGTDKLLDLIRVVVSRLPAASPSSASTSLRSLILTRLTGLLSRLSTSLDLSTAQHDVLQRFYLTTMALTFVRFEAGLREGKEERELWTEAVEAGLKGKVEELKKEVLRSVCQ